MTNKEPMFYVAADPQQPGAAWACCVDEPDYAKYAARHLTDWIKQGAEIKRVDGDTMRAMLAAWVRPKKD